MLKELIKQLKEKDAALKALESGAPTTEALMQMKALSDEINALIASIDNVKAAEASRAKAAQLVTVDDDASAVGIGHNSAGAKEVEVEWPMEKLAKGDKAGLIIGATLKAGLLKKNILEVVEADGGSRLVKELFGSNTKLLNTGTNSAGGFTIPTTLSNDLIPLLYPKMIFLQANPRRVPLIAGKFEMPGALTGATAGWVGEGAAKPYSEGTFRKIDMKAKKIAAISGLTWEMQNYSVFDMLAWVQQDLRGAIGTGLDTGLLMGAGTGNIPLGILKILTVGTRAAVNAAAPTIAQIDTDLSKPTMAMSGAGLVDRSGWRWIMSERTAEYVSNLRDGISGYAYPSMQGDVKRLKNIPVLTTPVMVDNLGSGTNESTIALVDFSEVIWGSSMDLTTKVSDVASVDMGSGLVSAWQNNLIFALAEMTADVEIRRDAAVQLLTAVKWGS